MKANKELIKLAESIGFRKTKERSGPMVIRHDGNTLRTDGPEEIEIIPTIYDLQTWLRDVAQIYVEVKVDCTTAPKYCYDIRRFTGNPENLAFKCWWWETDLAYTLNVPFGLVRTYEEALVEGITESIQIMVQGIHTF